MCCADEAEGSDLHHVDQGMDDGGLDESGEMSGKSCFSYCHHSGDRIQLSDKKPLTV